MRKMKIVLLIVLLASLVFGVYSILKIKKEQNYSDVLKEELIELVDIPEQIEEEPSFKIDFKELEIINSDIVGWIMIDGTQVNYPIVQGNDNSYYLNHSYDKKWNSLGSVFMDYQSSKDFSDLNTFIYGHHSKNGSMFGELYKYMNYDFYNEHPSFEIYTPNGNYIVEIFSVYLDDANSDSYNQKFSSLENYVSYINLIKDKSNYKTNIEVSMNDKIITLYSCSHEANSSKSDRYYIHGKLVKI